MVIANEEFFGASQSPLRIYFTWFVFSGLGSAFQRHISPGIPGSAFGSNRGMSSGSLIAADPPSLLPEAPFS